MSQSGSQGDVGESTGEGFSPSISDVLTLLADEERQALVQYLLSQPGPAVDVANLVAVLVDVFEYDRTRAVIRLRHDHLPRLAAHQLLDYDEKRSLVWFDERADHVDHDDLRTLFETAAALSSGPASS